MYKILKKYFDKGYYTSEQVKVFVNSGYITEAEYEEITGQTYVA